MSLRGAFAAGFLALPCLLMPAAADAQRYDPGLSFRSLRTAHFTVHYHQGEDADARRLAVLAEDTRGALEAQLGLEAPRHTHVILVDQTDRANGWATPLPYNVIELTRAAPAPHSLLGQHDDWLRMVFVHEYTHVMHLDQVGGVMRAARLVLGRHPLSFPNLFLPAWQIEGLATFAESASGQGRVHAADVRAVLRAQWQAAAAPTLDRLSGGLVAWPGGWAPYFYGGAAMDDLARRAGTPTLGAYVRATARRPPYFGQAAFRKLFGESPHQTWSRLAAAHGADAAATPGAAAPDPITRVGYMVSGPRFRPSPAPAAADTVVYSASSPHTFPAIRQVRTDGDGDGHVVSRFVGDAIAFWRDWLIVDQLEFAGSTRLFADLWAMSPGRRSVRLSRHARLSEPDVSPDGATLAAVQVTDGIRVLALRQVRADAAGRPQLAAAPQPAYTPPGCSVATPRWAPDNARLAAGLHCAGSLPRVAVYHVATRQWNWVAPVDGARDLTPAWTPDGRWVIFASDRAGGPPALFAAAAAALHANAIPVLAPAGGATWPDISPDGSRLVFVTATANGLEACVAPMPALPDAHPTIDARPGEAPRAAAEPAVAEPPSASATPPPATADHPYSPWRSLLPRYWEPWVDDDDGDRVGALVTGTDVLGRHRYALSASWRLSMTDITPGFPAARAPDWAATYVYGRWRPQLFLATSSTHDALALRDATAAIVTALAHTREIEAGAVVSFPRVRLARTAFVSAMAHQEHVPLTDSTLSRQRRGLRAGWALSSARQYGYSISPEDGVRLTATIEEILPALGADGRATTATVDARAYVPVAPRHGVLALRLAGGASRGQAGMRRVFAGGGSAASPASFTFSRDGLGLLRGLDTTAIQGLATAGGSLDYRFPLANVERGFRQWPAFLNQLHGAVFADYVSMGRSLPHRDQHAWSTGAELSAQLTLGYGLRVTATAGAAWVHDAQRTSRPGRAAAFARTGFAF